MGFVGRGFLLLFEVHPSCHQAGIQPEPGQQYTNTSTHVRAHAHTQWNNNVHVLDCGRTLPGEKLHRHRKNMLTLNAFTEDILYVYICLKIPAKLNFYSILSAFFVLLLLAYIYRFI